MTAIRLEDLSPDAQAALARQEGLAKQVSDQIVGEAATGKPGPLHRLNDRLAGPWPGIGSGFWPLIGWAVLMALLAVLFQAVAIAYVGLAIVALVIGAWRSLRGGKG